MKRDTLVSKVIFFLNSDKSDYHQEDIEIKDEDIDNIKKIYNCNRYANRLSGVDEEATMKNIDRLMIEKGFTDNEVGEMLFVSRQAVNKWRHIGLPDLYNLYALSGILEVDLDDLLVPRNNTLVLSPEGNHPSNIKLTDWKRYFRILDDYIFFRTRTKS